MALHDHDLVGPLAAALDRDRVAHQRCGGYPSAVGLDHLADGQHFEAIAALRPDAAEFVERPIHRCANAALGIGLC